MTFTRGLYTVSFENKAYIKAIATYNKYSDIHFVTDANDSFIHFKTPKKLGDLPKIVEGLTPLVASKLIKVRYITLDSISLINVFPTLNSIHNQQVARQLETYNTVLRPSQTSTNADLIALLDQFLSAKSYALTRETAILLIKIIPCLGALELKELNTILFLHGTACFYLTYGNDCQINEMNNIALDIDEGFLFEQPEKCNEQVNKITAALQQYFIRWKDNNYEGPLFPQHLSLEQQAPQTVSTTSQCGFFANPSQEMMEVSIGATGYIDFEAIDKRIVHNSRWLLRNPMSTSISIPKDHYDEILTKLKQHQAITDVAGYPTAHGDEIQQRIKRVSKLI